MQWKPEICLLFVFGNAKKSQMFVLSCKNDFQFLKSCVWLGLPEAKAFGYFITIKIFRWGSLGDARAQGAAATLPLPFPLPPPPPSGAAHSAVPIVSIVLLVG